MVSGGDIWTVAAAGGEARLLVAHEAAESRPLYSPEGDRLAFVSDRTGGGDIYVLTLKTGALKQLTFDDGLERLDAWSRDGRWLYFSSTSRDIAGMNDLYRVRADGGTPMLVSADRYTGEFFAAPSPDGQRVAFSARGNSSAQWWRKGHSHLDESRALAPRPVITRGSPAAAPRFERLTERGAKQMWPMWSADGRSLFYMSDRSGAQNIWTLALGGAAKQVTRFTDGRVLWPTISYDGRTIVFERDFEVWKLDTGNGQASKIPITKRGVPSAAATEHVTLNNQFQDLALSPDGRKVVFVARGEIWAASARDGGDAVRVTRSYARESQIEWAPDSRRIVYVSERDARSARVPVRLHDVARNAAHQRGRRRRSAARLARRQVGRVRARRQGPARARSGREDRAVARDGLLSRADRGVAWSPDSKWVAYLGLSARVVPQRLRRSRRRRREPRGQRPAERQRQQHLVEPRRHLPPLQHEPADRRGPGRARRSHPAHAEVPRGSLPRSVQGDRAWTPAPGERRGGGAAPDRDRDAEPARDPSKPVEIVFDDIRRRLSLLPVGVDVTAQTISPDGRSLLLTATAEGQQNLYVYSLDELAREPAVARQLTSTAGAKADAQFTPDSREIFYLEQGRITVMPVETRVARPVAVTAELDVDFAQEKMEVFRQAWTYMRDGFYDDKFHGVNWDAVRTQYAPRIAGAQTPSRCAGCST